MKRTPLKRGKQLQRGGPLKVKKTRKRWAKEIRYSIVRQDVESRSGGRCEVRTPECVGRGWQCHHLLPRSQGGRDEIANCVWTCAPCHRYLHANPAESYERGWLRHREAS